LAFGQAQNFVPSWSMPQVTQQSWVQFLPQLTLWQSAAQAPPGSESGFGPVQVQLPGYIVQIPTPPPAPVVPLPPVPAPVEPPVPDDDAGEDDEHAKNTKLCATSAATPRVLNWFFILFLAFCCAGTDTVGFGETGSWPPRHGPKKIGYRQWVSGGVSHGSKRRRGAERRASSGISDAPHWPG
jgi:hypothetical protein